MDQIPSGMTDEQIADYYRQINEQQQANNAWSAEQAQKAMDYQTQMSNTAHQREVQDLIAAGLNPVLSAGGSGATSGSGIAASSGNENVSALYGLFSKALTASIEQSRALQNSASGLNSNSGAGLIPDSFRSAGETMYQSLKDSGSTESDAFNAVLQWVKRKTGIDTDTARKIANDIISRGSLNTLKPEDLITINPLKQFANSVDIARAAGKKVGSSLYSSATGKAIASWINDHPELKKFANSVVNVFDKVASHGKKDKVSKALYKSAVSGISGSLRGKYK